MNLHIIWHALMVGWNFIFVKALDFADDNKLPLFPNLIRLNLIVPNDYSWRLLPDLLCSAPNLATLVLWKALYKGDLIHEFSWVEPHKTTSCFLSKLEELVVIQFHGVDSELKLLKYFLENGSVLKKVLIDCSHLTLEGKSNFLEKVLQFQRVSKTCQIEHCDSPVCVKLWDILDLCTSNLFLHFLCFKMMELFEQIFYNL